MVSQQYVCSFDLTTRASNEKKKEVRGPETPSSSDLILASMTPITCRQTFSSRRWHTHAAEKLVPTKHGVNPLRLNRTICEALSSEWQLLSQVTARQDVTNLPPFVVFWSTIWWTQSVTNSLHKRFSLHPTTTCQNKLTKADVGGNLICLHLHISSGKMVNANFFEVDMFVGVFPHGFACSTWQTKHIDQSIWRHQPYAPQQIFISQTSWERLFWIIWLCTKYHKGLLSNRVHW